MPTVFLVVGIVLGTVLGVVGTLLVLWRLAAYGEELARTVEGE